MPKVRFLGAVALGCLGLLLSGPAARSAEPAKPKPAPAELVSSKLSDAISCEDLRKMQANRQAYTLLDARDKRSYDMMHIESAELPFGADYYEQVALFHMQAVKALPDTKRIRGREWARFSKDNPVVTYCNTGCHAGDQLAKELREEGFKNVLVLKEGMQTWQNKGYPVILGKNVVVVPAPVAAASKPASAKPTPDHKTPSNTSRAADKNH